MKASEILIGERDLYDKVSKRNFIIFGLIWLMLLIDLMIIIILNPEHLTFFSWIGVVMLLFLMFLTVSSSQANARMRNSANDLISRFNIENNDEEKN